MRDFDGGTGAWVTVVTAVGSPPVTATAIKTRRELLLEENTFFVSFRNYFSKCP